MRRFKQYFTGFWLLWLMIIEWVLDLISKLWQTIHGCFKELTEALVTIYNELKQKPGEPDSRKV